MSTRPALRRQFRRLSAPVNWNWVLSDKKMLPSFGHSAVVIHFMLKSFVFHVLRRCLGCQRLLQSDQLQGQRKLKLKVLCLFRPVSRSRM
jgi:hypothetical protein